MYLQKTKRTKSLKTSYLQHATRIYHIINHFSSR